ncbi:MAG: glutaredoxin family protein [Candidatus Campbellbacteria bacterium]|nr:glutaredoxin family protein [Candidatus Campbellbacteria bacterium]
MKNITIYSTPTCHFCNLAKNYFQDKGIEYTDYDVSENIEKQKEMIEKTGQMGVPVIMIGDEVMVGFNQAKLEELLS